MLHAAVVALGVCASVGACIVLNAQTRRRRAVRSMAQRSQQWRDVGRMVARFCSGEAGSEKDLHDALAERSSRHLVVRALADAIRADPDLGQRFRGRDAELSILRSWAIDQLSADDDARREAAEVVGTLRMRSCVELLVVALDDTTTERTRETICRALVTLDPRAAVGVLLRLVGRDAPSWVGDLLAIAMSRGGAASTWRRAVQERVTEGETSASVLRLLDAPIPRNAPVLRAMLESSDPGAQRLGLDVLAGARNLRPFADLVVRLLDDDDAGVRIAALRVIEGSGGGHGLQAGGRRQRRGGAAAASAMLPARLAALLGDEVRGVRFAAAAALLAVDPSRAILRSVAGGGDTAAAEAARVALLLDDASCRHTSTA